jgi:hypothetical protein
MKVEGSCHCGAIGYEAVVNPEYVVLCHCTDCQNISGAPYRANVPVLAKNFTLRGTPKIYVKTADSGNQRALAFCDTCGSALYSVSMEKPPPHYMLRVGAIKQRAQLPPKRQGFCRSAMPWAKDITNVPEVPL